MVLGLEIGLRLRESLQSKLLDEKQLGEKKLRERNLHGMSESQVAYVFQGSLTTKYRLVIAEAAKGNRNTKPNSVICADCDGNGAVLCSQCKGSGVNSVDFFNGQFKAGDSCWLCGGRKEMLCGNCNGAGFVGGQEQVTPLWQGLLDLPLEDLLELHGSNTAND
ncbi:unnamed protein product [Sphenostylis stenocarpa]|uniref:BSD2 cysteine rich domain-containing protein n=1 Tax=Sphenostylis stenocarpa TaxID=92480 RepID=A0AA86TC97_9FABA|nr:unnamed protein product [Sphenostylis stenocarpa]